MTVTQKWIAALGAVAIFVTMFFAPYRVGAHNELERIAHGGYSDSFSFTAYAPLWSLPQSSADAGFGGERFDDVQLDAGKLGIWWAAIAVATVLSIVLAAPRREVKGV